MVRDPKDGVRGIRQGEHHQVPQDKDHPQRARLDIASDLAAQTHPSIRTRGRASRLQAADRQIFFVTPMMRTSYEHARRYFGVETHRMVRPAKRQGLADVKFRTHRRYIAIILRILP